MLKKADTTLDEVQDPAPTPPAPLRMSYEEYLAWDYEGGLTEWVDGEVIIHMPAKEYHQRVVVFLIALLKAYVQLKQLGRIFAAPYGMRAIPGGNAREPDLFFVATEHLQWVTDDQLEGPADLVVEVLSEDSASRDRTTKLREYEAGGVREYWLLDPRPRQHTAEFYLLHAQGHYHPVAVGADGIYHATVLPGFWLKRDWLWQQDPDPWQALDEVVGLEQIVALKRSRSDSSGQI